MISNTLTKYHCKRGNNNKIVIFYLEIIIINVVFLTMMFESTNENRSNVSYFCHICNEPKNHNQVQCNESGDIKCLSCGNEGFVEKVCFFVCEKDFKIIHVLYIYI